MVAELSMGKALALHCVVVIVAIYTPDGRPIVKSSNG